MQVIYIFLINLFHYSNFVHYTLFQSTFIYIGIEDKLVSTSRYGIVVTDEASSFFQDIKGQDNQNESNIGLMNQLFDGHGEKRLWLNYDKDTYLLIPHQCVLECSPSLF